MKNKLATLALVCFTLFSCKTEDKENNTTNNILLIGEWLRSDFSNTQEYKLTFEDNKSGYISNIAITSAGTTSGATPYYWETKNNELTLSFDTDDEPLITQYEIVESGNLKLTDFSDFEFIKQ